MRSASDRECVVSNRAIVIWDFDGTLGVRTGGWSGCLVQVLDEYLPGHGIRIEDIRPHLSSGFPWHSPECPHPGLGSSDWWTLVEGVIARAYKKLGFDRGQASRFALAAHQRYIDPRCFRLYDDTIPAMETLAHLNWQHIILSNHVPELPDIVSTLGLGHLVVCCLSSANTGYEKPSKRAYEIALEAAGLPQRVWMVGDSFAADIRGAQALNIPAILVRNTVHCDKTVHCALDLTAAAHIIIANRE